MNDKTAKSLTIDIDITKAELDEAKKAVGIKLRQAIIGVKHQLDPGRISSLGADLRMLEFVNPLREPQAPQAEPVVDPKTAARRAAASDDGLMQVQNRATNKRERAESAKEEG